MARRRLLTSLRSATRAYARTPALTLTLLITATLGLAAGLASFTLADTLVLRPLAGIVQADRLVRIAGDDGEELHPITPTMRETLRAMPVFDGVCEANTIGAVVTIGDRVTQEGVLHLSGDCLALFGTRAQAGRLLTDEDDRTRAPVAVVTDGYWRRELDAAPDTLGRTLSIGAQRFTIVGILAPGFRGLSNAFAQHIVVPGSLMRTASGAFHWTEAIGRLAPGVTAAQARAAVETAWPRLIAEAALPLTMSAATRRQFEARRAFVGEMPGGIENARRPRFRQPLLVTLGLSVLMLAICAANVASLMAARAIGRRRDEAVRIALGAGRTDIGWQRGIDAFLPIAIGALLAWPLARAIDVTLLGLLQASYRGLDPDLGSAWNWRGAAFLIAGVVVLTMVGLLAQRMGGRRPRPLADELRDGARSTGDGVTRRRRWLVGAQVALTVLLVCGAARFSGTLMQHYAIAPGFAVENGLVTAMTPLPGMPREARASAAAEAAAHAALLARIEAIPGVRAASLSAWIPLGSAPSVTPVERLPARAGEEAPAMLWSISDRFFDTLGIPLIAGRPFAPLALNTGGPVPSGGSAIISASLAARLFPAGDAVGSRLKIGLDPRLQDLLIVGIAADAHVGRPQDPRRHIVYLHYAEGTLDQRGPYLIVRGAEDHPERLTRAITAAILAEGRALPLFSRTLEAQWTLALGRERLLAGASGAFGLIGLALAAAGLFGLLTHVVTTRRAEIGIRLAIGADAHAIARMLLTDVAALLAIGGAAGAVLLYAASRAFDSLLTGVAPLDPRLLGATLGIITVVALAAIWLPLRRARAIDPAIALRGGD